MKAEYTTEKKYKVHGFNDTECTCHVCGKQELKGTYIMENLSTGEIFRAGSTCGAKMAGWTTKELVIKYKAAEQANLDAAIKEFRESTECINYNKAVEFLNTESIELNEKVARCYNEDLRNELYKLKRSVKGRMEYLEPFSAPYYNKRDEIATKYKIKTFYLG